MVGVGHKALAVLVVAAVSVASVADSQPCLRRRWIHALRLPLRRRPPLSRCLDMAGVTCPASTTIATAT
jgi:hypothetical protein